MSALMAGTISLIRQGYKKRHHQVNRLTKVVMMSNAGMGLVGENIAKSGLKGCLAQLDQMESRLGLSSFRPRQGCDHHYEASQ